MNKVLIVDDDVALAAALQRSFERRGYTARVSHDLAGAMAVAIEFQPGFAVVDLRLHAASGLEVVKALHGLDANMRIVVLTGYASIATAVEAIKLGAVHYLTKPANVEDILKAFAASDGNTDVPVTEAKTSLKTLEWERIHEVLVDCGYNVSEAARRLGLHRRTLARKLEKRQIR
jgi:two-component system, response regulator RegA